MADDAAKFTPQEHGFHFSNDDITWSVAGISGKELCGGMVYAALDYFNAKVRIPSLTTPPRVGTTLQAYIQSRQNSAHVNEDAFFVADGLQKLDRSKIQDTGAALALLLANVGPCPLGLVWDGGSLLSHPGHTVLALGCDAGPAGVTLTIYNPSDPDRTNTLFAAPGDNLKFVDANHADVAGFFVDSQYSRNTPPDVPEWRWCTPCQGLFCYTNAIGACSATGGAHVPSGVKVYRLDKDGLGGGEGGWKFCYKCQGLFWNGDGNDGTCQSKSGGDAHSEDIGTYVLPYNSAATDHAEGGWRYCPSCRLLYWAGDGSPAGICPALGQAGHSDTSDSQKIYYLNYE